MKLSVIIVNYNVRHYLEQCLLSVRRALAGVDGEVIVVDNNSSDGSVEYVRKCFPEVKVIANSDNPGFSKANNQAIRESTGEYVLLLNPDTFIGENALADCVEFMDRTPDAGICGVMMLKADGAFAPESRRGVPTPFTSFCKMSGLGSLFPKSRTFGRYYMRYLDEDEVNGIDIVSGAFMFIRRDTLDKIGLLDESFFMYGEDVDLSYRSLLGGYRNYYVPTPILHYKGESTKKTSMSYINAFHKAMIIFFKKHFGKSNAPYVALVKAGVCMKGAMAYVYNLLDDVKTRLFNGNDAPKRVLLVASGEHLDSMRRIAQAHNCQADCWDRADDTMPEGEVLNGDYDYVVFDTDRYPYTSILEFFRHRRPNKGKTTIGTFIPQSDTIITLFGVMRMV